jgi:hypothetical protein
MDSGVLDEELGGMLSHLNEAEFLSPYGLHSRWGRRLPYFGDSMVANYVEYRHDTPLQCTVGGVAGAQLILFGLFGLRVGMDGSVAIRPCLPEWAGQAQLRGLRICGCVVDICVSSNGAFKVTAGGKRYAAPPGEAVFLACP